MPTRMIKTANSYNWIGDIWCPEGDINRWPQIGDTRTATDAKMRSWMMIIDQDDEHPEVFSSLEKAIASLNARRTLFPEGPFTLATMDNPIDETIKQALLVDDLIAQLTILRAKWGNVPVVIGADPRDVDIDMGTASAVKAEGFWWYEIEAVVISSPSFFHEEN